MVPLLVLTEEDPHEKDCAFASRVAKLAIEHGVARGGGDKVVTKRS